jgi:hypothetical protein
MSSFPKRIINKIKKIERSIVTYPIENKLQELKARYEDKKYNRELVTVDKYGNRYYQHYTSEGIPSKRYVHINFKAFHKWEEDPTMQGWLQGRRDFPPTQEELERNYINQENMERNGLEWDKKEQRLIEEYNNKRRQAISVERRETGAIGENNNFLPGKWKGENKALTNLSEKSLAIIEHAISELPKWDVTDYNNLYGLKGKYIVDFDNDDLEYRKRIDQKRIEVVTKVIAQVNMDEFTPSKMSEKYLIKREKEKAELKEEFNNLTNLGKKMLEKKNNYQRYAKFRINFKDVFENTSI